MPKRIVLCFDGTWNTPSDPADLHAVDHDHCSQEDKYFDKVDPNAGIETNVCRLFRSVWSGCGHDRNGGADLYQIKWYDKGIGTEWWDRVPGGAFGLGLSRKIREGYKKLSDSYDDGDHVFIFGFSRGAYTARSLVGFIRNCGLLPRGSLTEHNSDDNDPLMEAYEIYRTCDESADAERARIFRQDRNSRIIPIKFLGVWDTVGALGIPIESFDRFNKEQLQFHDTELSGIVENAYHAIAVDEHRKPYEATLWNPREKPKQIVEQRWFIGAHADVGGGYDDRRLSDITLRWMQDKAESCGLRLDPRGVPDVTDANAEGSITDSFRAFLGGLFSLFQTRYYRPIGRLRFGHEVVDATVQDRGSREVTYRPKNPGLNEVSLVSGIDNSLEMASTASPPRSA
jgi:uncharacterized protein (DUF2235 family)